VSGLRRISGALESWTPGEGLASPASDPLLLLAAAWPEIVGENNAANSHPSQVVGQALQVTTRSSVWSQQLSFLSEEILAKVRARLPRAGIELLRFRVGKLPTRSGVRAKTSRETAALARPRRTRTEAATIEEALDRFRAGVDAAQRAKRTAGWKECIGCNALIAPTAGLRCVSCQTALDDERIRQVARLLYEAPWLGYAGTAKLVERLSLDEYESIRRRLLARWWEMLSRVGATKRLSRDGRERLIASSYVVLKSGLPPERLVPATIRNVLGDELHDFFYETERIADH
jgi:hypothetical protein